MIAVHGFTVKPESIVDRQTVPAAARARTPPSVLTCAGNSGTCRMLTEVILCASLPFKSFRPPDERARSNGRRKGHP